MLKESRFPLFVIQSISILATFSIGHSRFAANRFTTRRILTSWNLEPPFLLASLLYISSLRHSDRARNIWLKVRQDIVKCRVVLFGSSSLASPTSQKGTAADSLSASQKNTCHDSTPEIYPQELSNLAIRSGEKRQEDVNCVEVRDDVLVNRKSCLVMVST